MKTIKAKHEPYYETGYLAKVIEDMKLAGAPTIRVMKFKDEYYALEGSHRLASAYYLKEIPKLVVEIEETDHLPDIHWEKVSSDLPIWNFEYAYVLDLNVFKSDKYKQQDVGKSS